MQNCIEAFENKDALLEFRSLAFLWFVLPGNSVNKNIKAYGQYQQNIVKGTAGYFPTVPISGCSTAQINKVQ